MDVKLSDWEAMKIVGALIAHAGKYKRILSGMSENAEGYERMRKEYRKMEDLIRRIKTQYEKSFAPGGQAEGEGGN